MMVNVHEYIVAYQKDEGFRFVGEKRNAEADGFKNPDNDSAGRLLDKAGGKLLEENNVKVWDKHATFIVNEGTMVGKS